MQHKYETNRVHTICPYAISPPQSQKVHQKWSLYGKKNLAFVLVLNQNEVKVKGCKDMIVWNKVQVKDNMNSVFVLRK